MAGIGFFIYLIISLVISIALSELTAKKPKSNLKAQGLDSLDFPTADANRSVPYIAGDVLVRGFNLIWYGDYLAQKMTKKVKISLFQSSKITTGFEYYIGMQLAISFGKIDALREIWFGEKLAWAGNATHGQFAKVDNTGLFGGKENGGGVQAMVRVMDGRNDQEYDDYMTYSQGGKKYHLKGLAYLIWKGPTWFWVFDEGDLEYNPIYDPLSTVGTGILAGLRSFLGNKSGMVGESPNFAALSPRIWRFPNHLDIGSNRHIINNTANPAEVLWELSTGRYMPFLGEIPAPHLQEAEVDKEALRQMGIALYNEGLGISFQWQIDGSVGAIIDDILTQIQGIKRENPKTGLLEFKLLRPDYDIDELPHFNEDSISSLTDFNRQAINATVNKVVATYTDKLDHFKEKPVTAQSNASMWMQSSESSSNIDLTYLTDVDVVTQLTQTTLNQLSFPAATGKLTTDRRAWGLARGDCFVLDWAPENIVNLVCRVNDVNYGNVQNNVISINFVEDVFAIGSAVFAPPPPSAWVPPVTGPAPVLVRKVVETTWRDVADQVELANASAVPTDISFITVMAKNPNGAAVGYDMQTHIAAEAYASRGDGEFCPTAIVVEATTRAPTNVAVTLTAPDDLHLVEVGTAAEYGGEIVRVVAIDWEELTCTLARGCVDTVPVAHAAGTRIWFYDADNGQDNTQYPSGSTLSVKLFTKTEAGILDPTLAPVDALLLAARQARPYPPAYPTLNTLQWPNTVTGALTVAWRHRNRLTQGTDLIDANDAGVPLEDNVRYALRFLDAANVLIIERNDIGGATAAVVLNYTGTVNMELYAISDAGPSWTKYTHQFTYTPPGGTTTSSITAAAYSPAYTVIEGGVVAP